MIYLETNSLRTLANKLSDPIFIQDKYTSILAIIELLSGIKNESEYRKRRGIINKIVESDIYNRIHPLFPITILYKAFDCNLDDKELSLDVIGLLKIIVAMPSYSDFINFITKNSDIAKPFRFTQNFDNLSSECFNFFMEDKAKDGDTKVLIPEFETRWKQLDFDFILDILVRYYASKIPSSSACGRNIEELITSYNKTINPFLLATSYYVDQKNSTKSNIGKNDSIDLLHILYISETETIVSDDKLLNKILPIAYPHSIIKTSDIR